MISSGTRWNNTVESKSTAKETVCCRLDNHESSACLFLCICGNRKCDVSVSPVLVPRRMQHASSVDIRACWELKSTAFTQPDVVRNGCSGVQITSLNTIRTSESV